MLEITEFIKAYRDVCGRRFSEKNIKKTRGLRVGP